MLKLCEMGLIMFMVAIVLECHWCSWLGCDFRCCLFLVLVEKSCGTNSACLLYICDAQDWCVS